jgi:hypothetical protein
MMYSNTKINKTKNHGLSSPSRPGHIFITNLLIATVLISASTCSASRLQIADKLANINVARQTIPPPSRARLIELAKTDHIELLQWSMALYDQSINDYTAVLHKQERIKGTLMKPQEIAFWFKDKPYSLLMKWEKNAVTIDKLLYVEGQENGNMFVHPTAPFSWIKSVKRKPRCKEALKGSLKTADQFGFYRNMLYIQEVLTKARQHNILQLNYLGESTVFGRDAIAMEAKFAKSTHCQYEKIVMHFDVENIIPIALAFYDRNGKLYSSYSFSRLKLNPGITEETFCKNKNKM